MKIVSTDKPIPLLLDAKSMEQFEVTHAASMRVFLQQTSDSLRLKGKSQGISLFFFMEWYTRRLDLQKLAPAVTLSRR